RTQGAGVRAHWAMLVAALAAGCSAGSRGGAAAVEPDAGTPASPDAGAADAGSESSGGGPGTADGGSDSSGAAYHLVNLGTAARRRSVVVAMAQNGLILARGVDSAAPAVSYVVDPHTGSLRSVPEGVRAINASGVLAGFRPVVNCNDFEAYLLFP